MSEDTFNPSLQQQQSQRPYWNERHRLTHMPILPMSLPPHHHHESFSQASGGTLPMSYNHFPTSLIRYDYDVIPAPTSSIMLQTSHDTHFTSTLPLPLVSSATTTTTTNLPLLYPANEEQYTNTNIASSITGHHQQHQHNLFSCQYASQDKDNNNNNNNNDNNINKDMNGAINERLHPRNTIRTSQQYIDLNYKNNNNTNMTDKNNNNTIQNQVDVDLLSRNGSSADNNEHNSITISEPQFSSHLNIISTSSSGSKSKRSSSTSSRTIHTTATQQQSQQSSATVTTTATKMRPLDMSEVIETLATLKNNGQMRKVAGDNGGDNSCPEDERFASIRDRGMDLRIMNINISI